MSQQPTSFAVMVVATGEVRDADGNLLNAATSTEPFMQQVQVADLAALPPEQLAAMGLPAEHLAIVHAHQQAHLAGE